MRKYKHTFTIEVRMTDADWRKLVGETAMQMATGGGSTASARAFCRKLEQQYDVAVKLLRLKGE